MINSKIISGTITLETWKPLKHNKSFSTDTNTVSNQYQISSII